MDIQTRKTLLIKWLEEIENINLIKANDSILNYADSDIELVGQYRTI